MRACRVAGSLLLVVAGACSVQRRAAPRASAAGGAAESTAHATARPLCRLADSAVEAAIAAVARARQGVEYCEYRHYAVDDLDGDSLDDLAVTFNVEEASGGTYDESYLMAFLTTRAGRAPILLEIDNVGGDLGVRYPDDISLDGDAIVVDFSDYLAGDPDCCPSGSSSARFRLTGDRLVEETPPIRRLQRAGVRRAACSSWIRPSGREWS